MPFFPLLYTPLKIRQPFLDHVFGPALAFIKSTWKKAVCASTHAEAHAFWLIVRLLCNLQNNLYSKVTQQLIRKFKEESSLQGMLQSSLQPFIFIIVLFSPHRVCTNDVSLKSEYDRC